MPDLISFFVKWWKFISMVTIVATAAAIIAGLLLPKQYLSTATALPANSVTADKARVFNNNIEALYSEFGAADELDKIEGTAALDTIYLAAATHFQLSSYYEIVPGENAVYKAAQKLKKNSSIKRSGYGELKCSVWDRDKRMAAALANFLVQQLQSIHQQLQSERNKLSLEKLKAGYLQKQKDYSFLSDSLRGLSGSDADLLQMDKQALTTQIQHYRELIDEYELSLQTNPPVLLLVEPARLAVSADKPNIISLALFTLFAAFVFAVFFSLFVESRNRN